MLPVNILQALVYDEEDINWRINAYKQKRKYLRNISDPFALHEKEFIRLFRLKKDTARYLINRITPFMQGLGNQNSIGGELKILAALSFFATGTYQRPIGQNFLFPMAQSTVSTCIRQITRLICTHLAPEFIKFPRDNATLQLNKYRFFQATGFPGAIAAVDGTHVAIIAPKQEEHNYFNRKGFHSRNVQIICDYDMRILNINVRYGGASHDSYIWNNSNIRTEMERRYNEGFQDIWLLGDSGYPQEPWLMTPITNALPNTPEFNYTNTHCQARCCIERCIGILKGRFRCICSERKLHYDPQTAGRIIVACATLHNMSLQDRLPLFGDILLNREEELNRIEEYVPIYNANNIRQNGQVARRQIIENYFQ